MKKEYIEPEFETTIFSRGFYVLSDAIHTSEQIATDGDIGGNDGPVNWSGG